MASCSDESSCRVCPERAEHAVDVAIEKTRNRRVVPQCWNRLVEPAFVLAGSSKRVLQEPLQLHESSQSFALFAGWCSLSVAPAADGSAVNGQRVPDFRIGHLELALNPPKRGADKLRFEFASSLVIALTPSDKSTAHGSIRVCQQNASNQKPRCTYGRSSTFTEPSLATSATLLISDGIAPIVSRADVNKFT
jgi:hypothetical protein